MKRKPEKKIQLKFNNDEVKESDKEEQITVISDLDLMSIHGGKWYEWSKWT